ncbi:unnamed protein product [Microthlaspi erraticum]|uniref:valine--tRNA ligase n=1 Tax=Microthlaspi erraticum TaxID=1685480 RepID=A0A6D2K5Z6_9BRAS|nr:unnamed protein product [Microthlaspi erraticum]
MLCGFLVLSVDHAGIATQIKVEDNLICERGMNRHDLGREEFLQESFTMDEPRSKAVSLSLRPLYAYTRKALSIDYRDNRIVNWDCSLRSAVSKLEVTHIDIKERTLLQVAGYEKPIEFGVITSFAYPLEDGFGEVIVATTRVETMLGDNAIAIHPDDARYKHLQGKFALHPFNGRKLPIICDETLVDPSFGTGCVKITPAHDHNDFEFGIRHNLRFINILTDDGKVNTNGGVEFAGMPRFTAREAVLEALTKKGLYRGDKDNEMRLERCSRTNDVIEPMVKPQWYMKCDVMAKEALDVAINDDEKNIKLEWLENIHDWCISRQLWWGHQIPAWYVTLEEDETKDIGSYNDHWIVARSQEEALKEAVLRFSGKKLELSRDPDVLDTWFSSGISPLSNLGWPDETDDLKTFYRTTVLETGHDILFFWVARMVMLYPLEIIEGQTLSGLFKRLETSNLEPKMLVSAKEGHSKDSPDGIPQCGADSLRFALASYTAQSDRLNMDILRVLAYRQWCNKLWNAVRFAMLKLGDGYTPVLTLSPEEKTPMICKWILASLDKAISKTVGSLNAYEFSDAANTVYAWWQYQFCDVYIEAIKPYFNRDEFGLERIHAQNALWVCLETGLRLLHPFTPFVTEEIWQRLPWPKDCERKASIMICDYPSSLEVLLRGRDEHAALAGSVFETVNENLKVYLKLDEEAIDTEAEAYCQLLILYYSINLIRQKEKLQKIMSASVYEEKVPANIKEDNTTKLAKLLQEFEFLKNLESETLRK